MNASYSAHRNEWGKLLFQIHLYRKLWIIPKEGMSTIGDKSLTKLHGKHINKQGEVHKQGEEIQPKKLVSLTTNL